MPRSLTSGRPWRVITIFALPLLVGNVVQQLYHFTDAAVVGRLLGVSSLAAVGSTTSFIFVVIGFSWGMATGFAIPTARSFGANDPRAMQRSVATGSLLTLVASLILTLAGALLARPALDLLQTPSDLIEQASTFAEVTLLGSAATMFFNYVTAIIRATGDSKTPLVFLILSCLLNAGFVVLFVGPLRMGVAGAALATVAAQAITVVMCIEFIRRRIPALHLSRAVLRPDAASLREHIRLGLPMGFQMAIISAGSLAVQFRLNELGSVSVASYTSAYRVDSFAVALLMSLGLAVSVFVAQNHGAHRLDRIRSGVLHALYVATASSVILGILLVVAGPFIIRIFIGDESAAVVELAMSGLTLNSCLYTVLGVLFVLRGALQGLGYTLIPTVTGAVELGARIATALWLAPAFGYGGIIWGTPLAWIAAVVILVPTYLVARKRLISVPPIAIDATDNSSQPRPEPLPIYERDVQ
ncbi:MATE family efflux transporter [Paenarthrobacter sp. NyZ202]|uniref:MATE family efflux transporter n=1 Tax=Paenarthrobacter sp. NyZ202 TaxID=3402689 RepID=UPI003CF7F1FE